MSGYHDDNFGNWENMDETDMVDFYHEVQRKSVEKKCVGCGRTVRIRPQYDVCSPCADKRERGADF